VGVLPCFLHQWNGARQLTLMGSGISDYLDPVFVASRSPAILSCLREYLATNSEWDICDWQDLSYNTPLDALKRDVWGLEKREEVVCSEAQLNENFESYWEQRPRHLRRNVRRYRDKATQDASLEFQVTSDADSDLLNALIDLHAARWSTKGEPGMVEANHSAEFLLDVAQCFAAKDMLRIFSLRCRGAVAAVILGFAYRGSLYGYLTGFDPAYRHFSPASILLCEALRDCCRQGLHAWNFCRGEEPYKAEWGAQPIPRCRIVLNRSRS
jgi:CelD/BcsL family acetyltransferase involved in cellulose biosynthesis